MGALFPHSFQIGSRRLVVIDLFALNNFSFDYFSGKTKDDIGPAGTIFSGGVAGVTLWTIIFPFDVIKSRQQVWRKKTIPRICRPVRAKPQIFITPPPDQVSGSTAPMFRTFADIYKREGLSALYSGLAPTVLRTFPATGALFFAYEYSKKLMLEVSEE